MHASSVARVRLSPPGSPAGPTTLGSRRVSTRSVCALPSKPPIERGHGGQRVLAVVPERRVAEVVREAGRLDHVAVAPEREAEVAPDLRDLEAVREAVAHEVVGARADHLRLGGEPAQRRRVHEPGAVAGERPAAALLGCSGRYRSQSCAE